MRGERTRDWLGGVFVVFARWVCGGCVVVCVAGALISVRAQMQSVQPMARDAHPSFEVASIKRSDPADQKHRFSIEGHRVVLENQSVEVMLEMSYGVHTRQIANAPAWFGTERFDVEGLPDQEGQPNVTQFQEMVRKLLAERFGLKVHTEKRMMARYSLRVVKGGPKMEATKSAPDALPAIDCNGSAATMVCQMVNVAMNGLAHNLQGALDRPVVDETGLTGKYDFTLKWTREDAPAGADADSNVPGLFTALQEQLGLKMEPSRGEVEMLVVDHAEQPVTN